jgi:hypothetical protein
MFTEIHYQTTRVEPVVLALDIELQKRMEFTLVVS